MTVVQSPTPGHGSRALIVDRDDNTQRMYATYLRLAGYEVDQARDGREALAKAISHHPQIIVTETLLPGIDGFRLCELLRTDESTQNIPIIVVMGNGVPADVSRAERAGADKVLVKPCLPDELLNEMQQCLARSHELRARSDAARANSARQRERSARSIERSAGLRRRMPLSRAFERRSTTSPPMAAPALMCPECDRKLVYQHSYVGGVTERNSEQWDYYECGGGCGTFQYRQRTRRLRKLADE